MPLTKLTVIFVFQVSNSHTSRIKNREPSSSEEEEVIPPKPKFRRLRLRHTSSSSEDAVPLPVSAGEDMDDLPDIVPEHTVTAEGTCDTNRRPTDSVRGLDDPIAGPSVQVKTESVESINDIPGPSNSAPGPSNSAPGPSESTRGPSDSSPESANVALGSTIKIERTEDTTIRANECTCDNSHRETDSVRRLDDPIVGPSVQVKTESVPDAFSGVGESMNDITGPSDSAPGPSDSAPGPNDSALEPSVSALGPSGNALEPSNSAPGPSSSAPGPSNSAPGIPDSSAKSANVALGSTIKMERSEDIVQETSIQANECTCETSHRETDSVRGLDDPIAGPSVQVKTENVSDACSGVRESMNDIPGPSDSALRPSNSAPRPSGNAPGPSESTRGPWDSSPESINVALGFTVKTERSEDIVQETSIQANECTCETSHRETDSVRGLDDPIAGPSVQVKTENVSDACSGVRESMNDITGHSDSAPGPSDSAPGPSDSSIESANVALGSNIKIERCEDILQETTRCANGCTVRTSGASDSVPEGDLPVSAIDAMGQKGTDRIPEPANSIQGPSDSIQGHNDDIPIKTEPAEGPTDILPVCRATQDTNGSPRGLPVVPGYFGYFPDPNEIIPLHFNRSPRAGAVITGTAENNQRPIDSTSIPRPTDTALGSINGVSGAGPGTSETVPRTTETVPVAVPGTTEGFPGTTGTVLGNTASSQRPIVSSPGPTGKLPKPTEAVPGPSFVTHPTDIICDPYNNVPGPSVSDTHPSIQGSTYRVLNLQNNSQSPNTSFPGLSDTSPRHTDIASRVTENIIGPTKGVLAASVETPGPACTTPGNTGGLEARPADSGPHTGVGQNTDRTNDNQNSDEGMFPNDDVDDIIAQIETEEKKHEEDKQKEPSNTQQQDPERRQRITYQQQILNSNPFSSDGAQNDAPHNVFIMTFCTGDVSNPQDEDAGSLIITSSEETDDEDHHSVNLTSNNANRVNITFNINKGGKTDPIPPRNVPDVQGTGSKFQSGADSSFLDGDRRLPSCISLRESWGPREGAEVNVRESVHRDCKPSTSNNVRPGQSSRSVPLTRNEVGDDEPRESPPEEGTQSDEEMPTRRKLNRSVIIVSDDENDLNITVVNTAQGRRPTPKTTEASNSQDSDSDTIPCDSDHEEEETPARRKTNRSLVIHSDDEDEEDDVQIVSSGSSESESDNTQRDENGNEKTGEVPSDSGSEESGGSSRGSGEEEEGSGGSSGDSSSSEEDVRGNSKRARVMRSKKDAWREKFERYRNARRKSKGEDKGQG